MPILRSIGTTLTNLENMQKSYVLFNVRDTKRYVVRHSGNDTSDIYFHQEHVLYVFGDLDLDL